MGQDKLPGIQFARAVAALSVCYFHSGTALDRFPKGTAHPIPFLSEVGWVGVDLFFAISGFVIAMQFAKPVLDIKGFLTKRAFRVYPLWWLCLSLFAAMALAWRGLQSHETAWWFLYSASLLPTEGYPFYDVGWSLQHEMMFYLASALFVPMFGIYGLLGFLATGAVLANHLPAPLQSLAIYYPEFIAGIFAFLLLPYTKRLGPAALLIASMASLYLLLQWGGKSLFPITLFLSVSGFATLRRAPLIKIGDASYSLYLLHPLVFVVAKAATIPVLGLLWIQEPVRWLSVALAIGMSLACQRYFERPINELGRRIAARSPLVRFA
jgi:peptidoglycan/LPS O-acetylase OafA/YrhL